MTTLDKLEQDIKTNKKEILKYSKKLTDDIEKMKKNGMRTLYVKSTMEIFNTFIQRECELNNKFEELSFYELYQLTTRLYENGNTELEYLMYYNIDYVFDEIDKKGYSSKQIAKMLFNGSFNPRDEFAKYKDDICIYTISLEEYKELLLNNSNEIINVWIKEIE